MTNLSLLSKQIRLIDGLYSLNDLHQVSGGTKATQPHQFLRNAQTKELIKEIGCSANSRIAYKTLRGGKLQGSWVSKELVYAYAMWISPQFHLQVIRAFDQMQSNKALSAPAQLDYQRILFVLENGQRTSATVLEDDEFVTSFSKLPNQIRNRVVVEPSLLLELSSAINERLKTIYKSHLIS